MKEYWPQKVSKIAAELLQLSLHMVVLDNVTNGRLSDVLTNTHNHREYFVGSINVNNDNGNSALFSVKLQELTSNSKYFQNHILAAMDYAANWFGHVSYRVLLFELPSKDTDIKTVVIAINGSTKTVIQQFIFNMNEKTVDDFRNAVINYSLDLITENLMNIPHLKLLNYE